MQAQSVTSTTSVILPRAEVPVGCPIVRLMVVNDLNRAQWIKVPVDARADTIESVSTAKRTAGWKPVLLAEVSEQALNAARARGVTPTLPPVAPVTLASMLDDIEVAPASPTMQRAIASVSRETGVPAVAVAALVVAPLSALDDVDSEGLAAPADDFARGQFLRRGVDGKLHTEIDPFDRMPTAVRALTDLRDEVQAEDRRDLVCGLADLRMTDKIQLAREETVDREGFEVRVEAAAIGRLQAELRAAAGADGDLGIATHAASSKPALRALASTVWNGYADALAVKEKTGADRSTVTLRTRMVEQRDAKRARQVYAVVSEKYGECDADKIAAGCLRLVERVGGDLRARVAYHRGDSSVRIDIFTQQREVAQVGDEFRATMRCKSNDAGKGGLKVWSTVERLACENGMVVAVAGAATLIRHLGDPARLQERLREALAASLSSLRQFSEQWRRASAGGIWLGVEATRAAMANGLTMWAKGQPVDVAHEAEVLAGRVVSGDEVLGWIAAKN